jgi:hypothetical protein
VVAREAPHADDPTRRRAPTASTVRAAAVLAAVAALVVVAGWTADGSSPTRPGVAESVEVLAERVIRAVPNPPTTLPAPSSTTTTTTTTTTTPAPPPTPPATQPAPVVSTTCADALAYLAANQAPGFTDLCADGSAFGHLGVTCVNHPGMCPGERIVHIACPAPFVYMNEAHNSWVLIGARTGIDPYGQGSDAQRAACAPHR